MAVAGGRPRRAGVSAGCMPPGHRGLPRPGALSSWGAAGRPSTASALAWCPHTVLALQGDCGVLAAALGPPCGLTQASQNPNGARHGACGNGGGQGGQEQPDHWLRWPGPYLNGASVSREELASRPGPALCGQAAHQAWAARLLGAGRLSAAGRGRRPAAGGCPGHRAPCSAAEGLGGRDGLRGRETRVALAPGPGSVPLPCWARRPGQEGTGGRSLPGPGHRRPVSRCQGAGDTNPGSVPGDGPTGHSRLGREPRGEAGQAPDPRPPARSGPWTLTLHGRLQRPGWHLSLGAGRGRKSWAAPGPQSTFRMSLLTPKSLCPPFSQRRTARPRG